MLLLNPNKKKILSQNTAKLKNTVDSSRKILVNLFELDNKSDEESYEPHTPYLSYILLINTGASCNVLLVKFCMIHT